MSENEEHYFLTYTSRSLLYWLFVFALRCYAMPAICCVIAGACVDLVMADRNLTLV